MTIAATNAAPGPTGNEDRGFFGTIAWLEADAARAWEAAFAPTAAATGASPEGVEPPSPRLSLRRGGRLKRSAEPSPGR